MAFYAPVSLDKKFKIGKSRIIRCCLYCSKDIAASDFTVVAKRNVYINLCFECFKKQLSELDFNVEKKTIFWKEEAKDV